MAASFSKQALRLMEAQGKQAAEAARLAGLSIGSVASGVDRLDHRALTMFGADLERIYDTARLLDAFFSGSVQLVALQVADALRGVTKQAQQQAKELIRLFGVAQAPLASLKGLGAVGLDDEIRKRIQGMLEMKDVVFGLGRRHDST